MQGADQRELVSVFGTEEDGEQRDRVQNDHLDVEFALVGEHVLQHAQDQGLTQRRLHRHRHKMSFP